MLSYGVENIPCTEKIITFSKKVIRYSHFHLLCFLLIYFETPCFIQLGDSTINLDAICTASKRLSSSHWYLQHFIIKKIFLVGVGVEDFREVDTNKFSTTCFRVEKLLRFLFCSGFWVLFESRPFKKMTSDKIFENTRWINIFCCKQRGFFSVKIWKRRPISGWYVSFTQIFWVHSWSCLVRRYFRKKRIFNKVG